MKATFLPTVAFRIATLVIALKTGVLSASAAVVPHPDSQLTLTQTNSTATLSISNSGDQVWIIARSTNLVNWTEIATWKVHNGYYRGGFTNLATDAQVFYRAWYDPARQAIFSTTSNAILLPASLFNYSNPTLPASFSQSLILAQDTMPATNITTDAGATLGHVLFYDKRLSTNQTIACASCHQPAHGFADPRRLSPGFDGSLGTRNTMGLSHARWYQRNRFFWDERAAALDDLAVIPIQSPFEMGMSLDALTNRLAAEPFYTNLFAAAFGSPDITTDRLTRALAQFVRSIVSTRSRYDIGVSNNFATFTAQELTGRQIFNNFCVSCHRSDNFTTDSTLNNNGLEFPYVDRGVGAITGNPAEDGKFKAPSLRNVELTAPYMHDGRFTNLEQVVEFYSSGIVSNPNLSPNLVVSGSGFSFSPAGKAAVVAFLRTLTDTNLATDPKLSDPFNYGN